MARAHQGDTIGTLRAHQYPLQLTHVMTYHCSLRRQDADPGTVNTVAPVATVGTGDTIGTVRRHGSRKDSDDEEKRIARSRELLPLMMAWGRRKGQGNRALFVKARSCNTHLCKYALC